MSATPLAFRWGHAVNSHALLAGVRSGVLAFIQSRASAVAEGDNSSSSKQISSAGGAGGGGSHDADTGGDHTATPEVDDDGDDRHDSRARHVNAVEADVIWSETRQAPVMGHPPQTDSELSLAAFLDEMRALASALLPETSQAIAVAAVAVALTATAEETPTTPLIVKLDFKSMRAFQASYELLRAFVAAFPFPRSVFVNADILAGPVDPSDIMAFPDAAAFLKLATALGVGLDGTDHAHKLVLSVGWTTANASESEWRRGYSHDMVDAMLRVLAPYMPSASPVEATSTSAVSSPSSSSLAAATTVTAAAETVLESDASVTFNSLQQLTPHAPSSSSPSSPTQQQHVHVTFPVRATSVRNSWDPLQRLLRASPSTFGFTLWWTKTQLPDEELEWLYSTLEGNPEFAARTFYDILGFDSFLQRRRRSKCAAC